MYTRADVADVVAAALEKMGFSWKPGVDPEHTHLFDDLGLDSMDGFAMVVTLEQFLGLSNTEENFSRTFTIRSVIETACDVLRSAGRLQEG